MIHETENTFKVVTKDDKLKGNLYNSYILYLTESSQFFRNKILSSWLQYLSIRLVLKSRNPFHLSPLLEVRPHSKTQSRLYWIMKISSFSSTETSSGFAPLNVQEESSNTRKRSNFENTVKFAQIQQGYRNPMACLSSTLYWFTTLHQSLHRRMMLVR